ncbi:Helix-turn-helix domain-containing protein [Allokutzneria albata]|uniref:Helix-turn-helix domain-containing protein n=2 Tax=Allokutzneria albata TaxID=211114 RepID=A0A1G9TTE4_ALLAB|nr:Helix-turn-helix domain-containing protein [Allokutzneria albata]
MALLRLSAMALSRSRFALSPLAETLGSLLALSRPCEDPWLADWHARHRAAFAARLEGDPFAAGLSRLLSSTKWLPDHVVIPPRDGMRTVLADELTEVAAAEDDHVAAQLTVSVEHSWREHDMTWLSGNGFAARTAELLNAVWHAHVLPDWPRRKALLERDVTYRAGLLAAYGWPRAIERMSRRSAWVGVDAIRFSDREAPDRVVSDEGMFFVPISASRGSWLCEAPPDRHAMVYPARGRAEPPREPVDCALDRLIGENRATILRQLEEPATSSELAAQLGLSLGTVGGHLAVLRDAQLITGERIGRRVVYRRTGTGDALTGA